MKLARSAPLLLALVSGCKASEGYGGVGWFGRSIASDWKTFQADVTGAPAYVSDHAKRSAHDLSEGVRQLAGYTRDNAKTTSENIAGAPAFIAREVDRDVTGL